MTVNLHGVWSHGLIITRNAPGAGTERIHRVGNFPQVEIRVVGCHCFSSKTTSSKVHDILIRLRTGMNSILRLLPMHARLPRLVQDVALRHVIARPQQRRYDTVPYCSHDITCRNASYRTESWNFDWGRSTLQSSGRVS